MEGSELAPRVEGRAWRRTFTDRPTQCRWWHLKPHADLKPHVGGGREEAAGRGEKRPLEQQQQHCGGGSGEEISRGNSATLYKQFQILAENVLKAA